MATAAVRADGQTLFEFSVFTCLIFLGFERAAALRQQLAWPWPGCHRTRIEPKGEGLLPAALLGSLTLTMVGTCRLGTWEGGETPGRRPLGMWRHPARTTGQRVFGRAPTAIGAPPPCRPAVAQLPRVPGEF